MYDTENCSCHCQLVYKWNAYQFPSVICQAYFLEKTFLHSRIVNIFSSNMATANPISCPFFRPWEYDTKAKTFAANMDSHFSARAPASNNSQDSGYDSDNMTKLSPSTKATTKRYLNPKAVEMMEMWYMDNFDHPYPSDAAVQNIVKHGGITVSQVKKWMANKRVRSNNTLTFNGTIHPKRLQRIQKEHRFSPRSLHRHHPYSSTPSKINQQPLHPAWALNFLSHQLSPFLVPTRALSPV